MTYTLRQTKHLEKAKEFDVATSIFEEIFRKTDIDVAAGEIYYLAQHLRPARSTSTEGKGPTRRCRSWS